MISHHHDSAAWLEVVHLHLRERQKDGGAYTRPGWYVRRTCDCHKREIVSGRFDTEAEAERCRDALHQDHLLTLAREARPK